MPIVVRRDGKELPPITVKPDNSIGAFFIGVTSGCTTRLRENPNTWLTRTLRCTVPGSSAEGTGAFRNGDKVVRIDDTPIVNYGQIAVELAGKADRQITVVVQRADEGAGGKPAPETRTLAIAVPPNPMRHLGLTMKMGEITAVQAHSPAAAAGIRPGDRIVRPGGDPMTLPDRLARKAGQSIEVVLERAGSKSPTTVVAPLRAPIEDSPAGDLESPLAVSALGAAYRVLNEVESVQPGSPADKAGLRRGDVILAADLIPPRNRVLRKLDVRAGRSPHQFQGLSLCVAAVDGVAPASRGGHRRRSDVFAPRTPRTRSC